MSEQGVTMLYDLYVKMNEKRTMGDDAVRFIRKDEWLTSKAWQWCTIYMFRRTMNAQGVTMLYELYVKTNDKRNRCGECCTYQRVSL